MPRLSTVRWALAGVLAVSSGVAIIATASKDLEENSYVPRVATDIRQPGLMVGSAGLGGLMILRSASIFLPKPWRLYIDRLEFSLVTMLWILWTSATMAFSASTISKTVCTSNDNAAPQCSTLTFDLFLLHLLSIACFAYLITVLSTALSPGYFASHSPSLSGLDGGDDTEEPDAFVMWELALGDLPKGVDNEPRMGGATYGSTTRNGSAMDDAVETGDNLGDYRKADRYRDGRIGLYVPLLTASLGVMASISRVSMEGYPGLSAIVLVVLAAATAIFTSAALIMHRKQREVVYQVNARTRRYRAIELSSVLAVFLSWPVAAILFTLHPSTSSSPCISAAGLTLFIDPSARPKRPDNPENLKEWLSTCDQTLLIIALSWTCAWIALARAANLIFPMPEVSEKPSVSVSGHKSASSGEEQPLLGARSNTEVVRPQVKYGRIVAGEAFELGDEDD